MNKIYCTIDHSTLNCLIITFYKKVGNKFYSNDGIVSGNLGNNFYVHDFISDQGSEKTNVNECSLKEFFDIIFRVRKS